MVNGEELAPPAADMIKEARHGSVEIRDRALPVVLPSYMQLRVDRQPAGISGYTCAVGFVFHLLRSYQNCCCLHVTPCFKALFIVPFCQ